MIPLKKNKAFTLIEVLGVITLIALLTLVALPLVINQVNQSKGKIDDTLKTLIYESTENYIEMNQSEYPKIEGNVYCITLKKLADYGFLKEPLVNPSNKEEIDLSQYVRSSFVSDIEAVYTITESCNETRN